VSRNDVSFRSLKGAIMFQALEMAKRWPARHGGGQKIQEILIRGAKTSDQNDELIET
jgi:hypothetical protein